MRLEGISNARLVSQGLSKLKYKTATEVVQSMGALQAQDYHMVKWAIGSRLKAPKEHQITDALDKGELIRTHLLRPTWHLVAAEHIRWMLDLTAPRIKSGMKLRHKQLGLTVPVLKKSNRVIEKALGIEPFLTRDALVERLNEAKLDTTENRAAHFLMVAELDGIICSGKMLGNKQSYTLLDNWVPKKARQSKDESLYQLASIYFTSRGPAQLEDFAWWSGLTITDAKRALDSVKPSLNLVKHDSKEFWFSKSTTSARARKDTILLLPAFDELLISYADRTATIRAIHQKKVFSNNGIFWPTIVLNGEAIGTWKRTVIGKRVVVETKSFTASIKPYKLKLQQAAQAFADFLEKELEFV